ncbi:MAG: ATP-dependent RNA helicase dbp10 [Peltula sp. TS41687]|nr:MAG: ATP-dependent RNA helicase dbp10 [Peltula sp. TS41687]
MPRRAAPEASDDEWDILKALIPEDYVSDNESSTSTSSEEDEDDLDHVSKKRKTHSAESRLKSKAKRGHLAVEGKSGEWVDTEGFDLGDGDGDDESFIAAQQAASNRKISNLKGRTVKKGGGFQAMGLSSTLLKAITRKGFSVPTPIQRKTIPLVLDGQDVVGMARTGSGKTAAFVLPMIEKLKAHSAKVGARALVLSPSRELALQTLKVIKELGRGTDLRSVLLVGGDSLEEQFGYMATNPDIIIATPGRFLHLQVEMALDLSSIRYVVFDEADRLFEMGFAAQLTEILHALPSSRQTLLFSATLPKSLVEFARAGLQEPHLIRLDAESKVSPDLESAFFTIKSSEKEGALLYLLNDVIRIPMGPPQGAVSTEQDKVDNKKRKRNSDKPPTESPTAHSTIVFVSTKHHVDYLASVLRHAGFAVSHAYGSLDQTARKMQVQNFRTGLTNILVVTDVAARGIDIPVLANVVNYAFPPQPKIFVHRVGRTARAGKRGRSYSLVTESDAPYLLDLQLFLGRKLILGNSDGEMTDFAHNIVVGGLPRDALERNAELASKLLEEDTELGALRTVAGKGEKLYIRTRNHASIESAKRAKALVGSEGWTAVNQLFRKEKDTVGDERQSMLARVGNFRPQETVFEIGKRGNGGVAAEVMQRRRVTIEKRKKTQQTSDHTDLDKAANENTGAAGIEEEKDPDAAVHIDFDQFSSCEEELEITYDDPDPYNDKPSNEAWKDSEHFMSYAPLSTNAVEDRGYGVHSGSYNTGSQNANFVEAARGAAMDLTNDEAAKGFAEPSRSRGLRWDKKSKKYVAKANDEDGSKGTKFIKGESGQKLAASFRSGRFDAWRKSNKISRLPRTGENETTTTAYTIGKRFKHKQERVPKQADKFRDNFHKQKARVKEAKEKRVGKFKDGHGRPELKSVTDVAKQRRLKEKRREKNARPARKRRT